MCLAVPVKVLEIPQDGMATVEVDGVKMNISSTLLPDLTTDDYVLVHAGFAIEKLEAGEAQERLKLLEEIYFTHFDNSTQGKSEDNG